MLLHVIFKDDLPISTSYTIQYLRRSNLGIKLCEDHSIQTFTYNYEDIKRFGKGGNILLYKNIIHVEFWSSLFNQDFIQHFPLKINLIC